MVGYTKGECIFPCPRLRQRVWSRETGSAVPSRVVVSPYILDTQAESGAYSRIPLSFLLIPLSFPRRWRPSIPSRAIWSPLNNVALLISRIWGRGVCCMSSLEIILQGFIFLSSRPRTGVGTDHVYYARYSTRCNMYYWVLWLRPDWFIVMLAYHTEHPHTLLLLLYTLLTVPGDPIRSPESYKKKMRSIGSTVISSEFPPRGMYIFCGKRSPSPRG